MKINFLGEWVEQCGLDEAWDGVIKAHGCSQIIGVAVDYELNDNDTLSLKFDKKDRVHKVYDYVKKAFPKLKFNPPTILTAIGGDAEVCHQTITPRFVINEEGKLVKNENLSDEEDEDVEDNKKRSFDNEEKQETDEKAKKK
eukprot:gene8595-9472_t